MTMKTAQYINPKPLYVLIGYVDRDDRPNNEIIKESKDLFHLKRLKALLESEKDEKTDVIIEGFEIAPENYKNIRIAEIEYIKS